MKKILLIIFIINPFCTYANNEECLDISVGETYEMSVKDIKSGGCIVMSNIQSAELILLTDFFDNTNIEMHSINSGLGSRKLIYSSNKKSIS